MLCVCPFCRQFSVRSSGVFIEMEKAKSVREIALGVIQQAANFWLLAEGAKCREPHGGNLLNPRKCSHPFAKTPRDRYPICGKIDIQKLLSVPLYTFPRQKSDQHAHPSLAWCENQDELVARFSRKFDGNNLLTRAYQLCCRYCASLSHRTNSHNLVVISAPAHVGC